MALTVKKTKGGVIIPKTPGLIYPGSSLYGSHRSQSMPTQQEIIEEEIEKILKETLGLARMTAIRRVNFFPVYKTRNGEKEINKIFLEYRTRQRSIVLDVDFIESFGVTLVEFFDYIITLGAKEIQEPGNALDKM